MCGHGPHPCLHGWVLDSPNNLRGGGGGSLTKIQTIPGVEIKPIRGILSAGGATRVIEVWGRAVVEEVGAAHREERSEGVAAETFHLKFGMDGGGYGIRMGMPRLEGLKCFQLDL